MVAGTYNLPLQTGDIDPILGRGQGCTVHIYWQAPDENRLVVSWYGKGSRVVDYSDPKRAKELGWFIPDGADTWSAKPHNGYIFTGDIARGFDVLRYTGEDGDRWPSTAGPAEVQRAEMQGARRPAGSKQTDSAKSNPSVTGEPTVNSNPGPKRLASGNSRSGWAKELAERRNLAGATFRKTVRLDKAAAKSGKAVLTIRSARGGILSRGRVKVKAGAKKFRVKAQITGVRGKYRYSVSVKGKSLSKGRFKLAGKPAANAQLKRNQTLVCRIIS